MYFWRIIALSCALSCAASAAVAVTYSVYNVADLSDALARIGPGDEIRVAPGDYGALKIEGEHFSPPVKFAPFAADEPPVFRSIRLDNVSGVILSEIKVVYGATQAPTSTYAISVLDGADITLEKMEISSAEDGVAGNDAYGIIIRDSARVLLSESRLHDLYRGVAIFDSDDVSIQRNAITTVGSDGVVGRGLVRAKINYNYLADFDIIDDARLHPDAIQIWTRGALRPSRFVEIKGNLIRRGIGDPSQGILVSGVEYETANLLIADNVIEQSMGQGIAVSNVRRTVIRNNTVIPFDFRNDAPGIDVRSSPAGEVILDGNLATAYRLQKGVASNGDIKPDYFNPWTADFVGNYITNPARTALPLDYDAIGHSGACAFVKDIWLGDPNVLTGSLTPPSVIADFDFTGLLVDRAPNPVQIAPATDRFGSGYYSTGVAPKLTAALNLKIDARGKLPSAAAGYRYIAALSGSYDLRVDRDHVLFSVWTGSGVTRLSASAPAMLDLSAHDLTADYDGTAGVMTVSIDGIEIARRNAPAGPIAYSPSYRLYAGGAPWGGSFGGGVETLKISR